MKVSQLLESRQANWQELEQYCARLAGRRRRELGARTLARFAALYRAACADLALADAYELPRATVQYLHELVGRAHNQLYRSRRFDVSTWARQLLVDVPQRLFRDGALWLAFCIFWGVFILSGVLGNTRPEFAHALIGQEEMDALETMYSHAPDGRNPAMSGGMFGFYVLNNPSIGLRVFALGLLLGVGGLVATIYNAAFLGAVFGYMATTPQSDHFFQFVTAHGPFELTAIVLSAAAGMRLGFAILDTGGLGRLASLERAAVQTLPVALLAVVLFLLAAMIEAFLSPSSAPYAVKAAVAIVSAGSLFFYFIVLGYPRTSARGTG